MASIGQVLADLKGRRQTFSLEALSEVLRPAWVTEALERTRCRAQRERKLPPELTVWFTVLLGLFRRVSYTNLLEKLHGAVGTHEWWDAAQPPCSSAITKARDRVGPAPLRELLTIARQRWLSGRGGRRFHGRRIFVIDGTTVKTPDTRANARAFGRPRASRGRSGFPQLRLSALMDLGTRVVTHLAFDRYATGELTLGHELLPQVPTGALLLADRLYYAAPLLWPLRERGVDFLVRCRFRHHARVVQSLGPHDAIVELKISWGTRQAHPHLPQTWRLRRVTVSRGPGQRRIFLLTSLTDSRISAAEIERLYRERWDEELAFDEIKTHLGGCATVNHPVLVRSKTPARVEQELYGLVLAYNALRRLMVHAAQLGRGDPRRLSFVGALERARDALTQMLQLPTSYLLDRYQRLLRAIGRGRVPRRPGRRFPRAVKVKMSNYRCKGRRRAS